MKYKRAKVQIRGIKPILFHAFSEKSIPLDGRTEKSGVSGNNPEEWKNTVLMDEKRQLYVPNNYIFGCIKNGAKYTKEGRGSIQIKVAASLQIEEDKIFFKDKFVPEEDVLNKDLTAPVYLYVCSVNNPNTKGRNIRYRIAASPGWELTFHIEWDGTLVNPAKMNQCLIDGGRLVGLGDGRSIGFGRFEVDSFALEENT